MIVKTKIIMMLILMGFTTLGFSQEIHKRLDYYKTDTLITFKDRKNYHVHYLKVELERVQKLTNNTYEYTYAYSYVSEFFDEHKIPNKLELELSKKGSEKFYLNDSAFFYCYPFSNKNLYVLLSSSRKSSNIFFRNSKDTSCVYTAIGTNVTVNYDSIASNHEAHIKHEKIWPISELQYRRGEGFTYIEHRQFVFFGKVGFKRCAFTEIPAKINSLW